MSAAPVNRPCIGWIGMGRMGFPMAERLVRAGYDVMVYNRTKAKAAPLVALGASLAAAPSDLATRDVVFTMVGTSDDLRQVMRGPGGLLSDAGRVPGIVVDCSSISEESSAEVRGWLEGAGGSFVAAPVSGNGKCVRAGKLSVVASGPMAAFDAVEPLLNTIAGRGASYVGEGDKSRIVKICHNVMLGVVAQTLAEVTVLAQKSGVPRHAFLDFINKSVVGSVFTRYKTPAYVNLDFTTTFTPGLLRKDLDLGLAAGRRHDVPLPVTAAAREVLQAHMGNGAAMGAGYLDKDFATLIEHQARASGITLVSENAAVSDGLEPEFTGHSV
ncbi:MAG TPA: NAD(P)-dependent oxidoreductase [Candidatus Cybelea sp.]|nr:NAD(P)-dependent oxidoreductase [Candidatus Cybelea sp.]